MLLVLLDFSVEHDLERLRSLLEARFHTSAAVSRSEFDPQPFFDAARNQYNSSAIIEEMEKDIPEEASRVLGVTGLDLFIPILTFVFGEARLNGRCAVISTYRLNNKLYGMPEDPKLLLDRLLKEAVHELGHTYGLIHCHNPDCVMKSSTYVEEIDYKSSRFCDRCEERMKAQRKGDA